MPKQQTQSDYAIDESAPQSSHGRVISLSCCAFLISYVMTPGPVAFIVKRIDMPAVTEIAEVLYAPVILVVKSRIPILSGLIKLYLGLFQ